MTAVSEHFAYRFAPTLMLLTEGRDSEGILLRPRFGRLELATDYARGDAFRAAAALAIGGVLASLAVARGVADESSLPRVVDMRVDGATRRFGWYVDRRAFGADLCTDGRGTALRAGGKATTAGAHLEAAWTSARGALATFVAPSDLRSADEVIAGRQSLPCEAGVDRTVEEAPSERRVHVLGSVTQPIVTPRLSARVVESNWNASVVEVTEYGATEPDPPPRSAPDEAVARAARSIGRGVPPVARHPVEPAAIEAAVFSGLADPARFVTSARLPATALSTVAAFLYERVWPRPRRKPMPRKYRVIGGLLLSTGLGIAVGGLLPPSAPSSASRPVPRRSPHRWPRLRSPAHPRCRHRSGRPSGQRRRRRLPLRPVVSARSCPSFAPRQSTAGGSCSSLSKSAIRAVSSWSVRPCRSRTRSPTARRRQRGVSRDPKASCRSG